VDGEIEVIGLEGSKLLAGRLALSRIRAARKGQSPHREFTKNGQQPTFVRTLLG
jgi:hypothetical protein